MSFNEMGPLEEEIIIPDDTVNDPKAKIEAGKPNTKENSEAFDSFEALEEDFDKIENEARENLNQAEDMAGATMKKIEGLYKNAGTEMPENIRSGMENLFSNYFSLMGDAMKIVEEKILYVKKMDVKIQKAENNDKKGRVEKLEQKKAEKIQEFSAQYSGIVKQYKDTEENIKKITNDYFQEAKITDTNAVMTEPVIKNTHLTPKGNNSTEAQTMFKPIIEEEKSIPENEKTQALIDQVTAERKLEESLSPGLLRLRKAGQEKLAALREDATLAEKLGITTFDDTPGGNTEKGGLQGIVEIQIKVGANQDGILGDKTEKALQEFLNLTPAPVTTASFPGAAEVMHTSLEPTIQQEDSVDSTKNEGNILQSEHSSIVNIKRLPSYTDVNLGTNPTFEITDENGIKTTIFIKDNKAYIHYYNSTGESPNYKIENGKILPTKQKLEAIYQNRIDDLGISDGDWDEIKNIGKTEFKTFLRKIDTVYKDKTDKTHLGYGWNTLKDYKGGKYPDFVQFLGEADSLDFNDWLRSDKGKKFLNDENSDTLSEYLLQ